MAEGAAPGEVSEPELRPDAAELRRHFTLEPDLAYLNHGSFGACPRPVQEAQARWRERMERQPVTFFARELEGLLDEARAELARFVGARPRDLAFVPNATFAVNSVLRSLRLQPGDELLATDHGYNACRNALAYAAEQRGARVIIARVPFPIADPEEALSAILSAVTPRTRLALIDHVTSPTALILPIERLARELERRGVDLLVDGAHAPGMLPLRLDELSAPYYTGNCHKWLCAPKGAGFLHVRADRQAGLSPAVVSHGANSPRTDRSRFLLEFDWIGTHDPSAYLSIPQAIRFFEELLPGGVSEVMARNHALALRAQGILAGALGIEAPAPPSMIGSMASLPIADDPQPSASPHIGRLQTELLEQHRIEVPIAPFPSPPRRVLRVSAQLYNQADEYERLARALTGR